MVVSSSWLSWFVVENVVEVLIAVVKLKERDSTGWTGAALLMMVKVAMMRIGKKCTVFL